MSKLPEKLSVLLGVGDTLLARLHKVKQACRSTERKPTFLTDQASTRILNTALKKFDKDGPDVRASRRCPHVTQER